MNYPFPTFLDNAATIKPLPAVVDQFMMGHNHRQEVTLVVDLDLPPVEIVRVRTGAARPLVRFPRPTPALWRAARETAALAAEDREAVLEADRLEVAGISELL